MLTPELMTAIYMIGSAVGGWLIHHYFGTPSRTDPAPAPVTPPIALPAALAEGASLLNAILAEVQAHKDAAAVAAAKQQLVATITAPKVVVP